MGNNATLLSWIVAEVDQALTLVRDQIAKFSAGSGDAALLAPCPVHLHQVSGALRMVGLAGATRFCELIERGFAAPRRRCRAGRRRPRHPGAQGIRRRAGTRPGERAAQAVPDLSRTRHAAGQAGQSRSGTCSSPISRLAAPPHTKPKTLAMGKVAAHVQKQRALFQRGLLAWLRNSTKGGLDDMRRARQPAAQGGGAAARAASRVVGRGRHARIARAPAEPRMGGAGQGARQSHREADARGLAGGERGAVARVALRRGQGAGSLAAREADPPALPARQPVPGAAEARGRAGIRPRLAGAGALRPALAPRCAEGRLGAVRRGRAEDRDALPRAGRLVQDQGGAARQPAPDQAAGRDRAGDQASARPVSAPEAVHGDRDGVRVPADRERHRPLYRSAARPRAADRHHGRLAAGCRPGQVHRRAARRAARGPERADRRAAAARAGGEGDRGQPAARRAGARRVCARSRQAGHACGGCSPTCGRSTAR